jgi:hypothetical protein
MEIVPFMLEHLDTFRAGERERALMPLPNPSALIGKAYSAIEGGRTLGIGGVVNGYASLLLSDELRARPVTLTRMIKRELANLDEVQATAFDGCAAAWLEHLGFSPVDRWRYRYVRT